MYYIMTARSVNANHKDVSPGEYTLRHCEYIYPTITMARAYAQKHPMFHWCELHIYEGNDRNARYCGSITTLYESEHNGVTVYVTKTKMYRLKKDGTLGNTVKR